MSVQYLQMQTNYQLNASADMNNMSYYGAPLYQQQMISSSTSLQDFNTYSHQMNRKKNKN